MALQATLFLFQKSRKLKASYLCIGFHARLSSKCLYNPMDV